MEVSYDEAVADLIAEAQRTAAWLTRFCCSHRGHEHGLDLLCKLDAVNTALANDRAELEAHLR